MRYLQVAIVLIAVSCSGPESNNRIKLTVYPKNETLNFIENRCYICHNPEAASHDELLAPPLAGVKLRYEAWYPEREAFIARMSNYIDQPSDSLALMRGAVMQFKSMPDPLLTAEESKAIAEYIFEHDLPQPSWFTDHYQEEHGGMKGRN